MTIKVESTHDDGGLRWLVTTETETHEPGRLAWLRANVPTVVLGTASAIAAVTGSWAATGALMLPRGMESDLVVFCGAVTVVCAGITAMLAFDCVRTPQPRITNRRATYYSSQGLAWWHTDGRLEPAKDDNPRAIPTGERARVPEPLNSQLVELYAAAETERMRELPKGVHYFRDIDHWLGKTHSAPMPASSNEGIGEIASLGSTHEGCEIPSLHISQEPSRSWVWHHADGGGVITSTNLGLPGWTVSSNVQKYTVRDPQ